MIGVDLAFGTAAYGVVAVFPALFANAGQSVELIRSPSVAGVSPMFLVGGVLNQVLWLTWGLLVPDAGTRHHRDRHAGGDDLQPGLVGVAPARAAVVRRAYQRRGAGLRPRPQPRRDLSTDRGVICPA